MPPALTTLYCGPQDVFDYLSTEGGQLRLDDHVMATGQQVTVTANALAAATSIPVLALTSPLLPGTVLEFDGGNMPAVVEAVLTAVAIAGSTSLTVVPLTAGVNQYASAFDSGVNTALAARLTKSCYYGTDRVNLYCQSRYDVSQLALSWSANRWATTLAAAWMCRRRAQPIPMSIQDDAEECLDELKQVNVGMLRIADIGTRTSGWPFFTNCTVDLSYDYRRIRVEQDQSEATPTQYGQYVDWNSALTMEW